MTPFKQSAAIAFVAVALSCLSLAQDAPGTAPLTTATTLPDQPTAFQKATLDIERQKLELETLKAWTTAAAIVIPILVGLWSIRAQARAQFELKATELVLASNSKNGAQRRANLLQSMFSGRLPKDFAESFQPENFPSTRFYEMKIELFRALISGERDKERVVQAWRDVFPEENAWFDKLFPNVRK